MLIIRVANRQSSNNICSSRKFWTVLVVVGLVLVSSVLAVQGMVSPSLAVSRGDAFAKQLPNLRRFHRRVYLLRHGQTDWNMRGLMQGGGFDIELNENGNDQAARVGNELSQIDLGIIASSHLQRSIQTANWIQGSSPEKMKRLVDARFGEMRFGDFEGTIIHGPDAEPENKQRFQIMLKKMREDIGLKWPGQGGECTQDVSERGKAGLESLLDRYPDENHIAVIAHGRFNKILLATLLWNDASRYTEIEQGNTCINVIDYDEEKDVWNPILINYIDHAPTADAKSALNAQLESTQETMLQSDKRD